MHPPPHPGDEIDRLIWPGWRYNLDDNRDQGGCQRKGITACKDVTKHGQPGTEGSCCYTTGPPLTQPAAAAGSSRR